MPETISIHEAARQLGKEDVEVLQMLRREELSGLLPEKDRHIKIPAVYQISVDEHLARKSEELRHQTKLDAVQVPDECIPPCEAWEKTAWDPVLEESVVKDCLTGAAAIAAYRAAFPRSTRTDKAITNHWSKLRHPVPQPRKKAERAGWRTWFRRLFGWLPKRRASRVGGP